MTTELRTALRDAVAEAPAFTVDPAALARAGGQRARRRARLVVGATALATAAVLAIVAVVSATTSGHRTPDPAPPELRRIDLDEAITVVPDVVATTRTTQQGADIGVRYDHFDGITADGLVLRTRYRTWVPGVEVGLLDPSARTTDWLPRIPGRAGEVVAVDLAADRLVLAAFDVRREVVLVFDRSARTWERHTIELASGIEVHVPPRVLLAPDDQLWIGNNLEDEGGLIHWWSAPLHEGGEAHEETGLLGSALAWSGGDRVTADTEGHVVISSARGDDQVSDARPADCRPWEAFPDAPVDVRLADGRAVVTYRCEGDEPDIPKPLTVVYDRGGLEVGIPGATVLAADDDRLLVSGMPSDPGAHPGDSATYLVDLDTLVATWIGRGPHEPQAALRAGLVLWNSPGLLDDEDGYDVRWSVARLD